MNDKYGSDEVVKALQAFVRGYPDELIDRHMRNLLDDAERAKSPGDARTVLKRLLNGIPEEDEDDRQVRSLTDRAERALKQASRVARRHLRAATNWRDIKNVTERAEWKLESSIKPQIADLWKKAYPKMERLLEQEIEEELGKAGYKVVKVRVSGLHHYMDYDLEKWDCEIHGEVESLVTDEYGDPEVLDSDELIETLSDEVGIWDGLTAKVGRKTTVFSGKDVRLSG